MLLSFEELGPPNSPLSVNVQLKPFTGTGVGTSIRIGIVLASDEPTPSDTLQVTRNVPSINGGIHSVESDFVEKTPDDVSQLYPSLSPSPSSATPVSYTHLTLPTT